MMVFCYLGPLTATRMAWQYGYERRTETRANVPHASFREPCQKRRARMQGNVQRGCSMETNVRSFVHSLILVISNKVRICAAE